MHTRGKTRDSILEMKRILKSRSEGVFTEFPDKERMPFEARCMFFLRKIIDKAFYDCFSSSKKTRREAYEWFNLEDEDFLEVCDNADLDAKKVFIWFKVLLKNLDLKEGDILEGNFNKPD